MTSRRSHTLHINGTRLYCEEAGEGDLLVFVHGTVADYRTWRKQFAELSDSYHVVSYSRRFHYPNAIDTAGEYSVRLHADDLVALLYHFGNKPAHIVTASWGGNIGLQLSLTSPGLVRTLVLGEPPTLPLLSHDVHHKHLLDEFTARAFLPARDAMLRGDYASGLRYFVNGVLGDGTFDAMPTPMQKYFMDNVEELKAETMSTEYIPDFTQGALRAIRTPTLLLEGDRSPRFFHIILDLLEESLQHVERHVIPASSHGMHADNASAYNERLRRFLSKH